MAERKARLQRQLHENTLLDGFVLDCQHSQCHKTTLLPHHALRLPYPPDHTTRLTTLQAINHVESCMARTAAMARKHETAAEETEELEGSALSLH